MKHILFIVFTLTLGTAYSQLPTRLKLKQLEQGTPGQTIVVDSLGNATYGSSTADGNGIYSSSDTVPLSTTALLELAPLGEYPSFGIGSFTGWDTEYGFDKDDGTNVGLYFDENNNGIGIVNNTAGMNVDETSVQMWANTLGAGAVRGAVIRLASTESISSFSLRASTTNGDRVAQISTDLNNAYGPIYRFSSYAGSIGLHIGTGNPNGVVTAFIGSIYLDQAGGAGTTLYIKESGNNTNTGWVAK